MIFIVLSIMTLCYFALASWQDLKERMLYTAPILFLHILWSIYLVVMTDWENSFFWWQDTYRHAQKLLTAGFYPAHTD